MTACKNIDEIEQWYAYWFGPAGKARSRPEPQYNEGEDWDDEEDWDDDEDDMLTAHSQKAQGTEELRKMEMEKTKIDDPDQTDFWTSALEKHYLNREQIEKFGVKYVRLLEFRDYHYTEDGKKDGLVYEVEVLNGPLKGKQKELTIWDKKAVKLAEEFGTRDIRQWVGHVLTITVEGTGQYRGVKLGKYEKLEDGGSTPASRKEEDAEAFLD